MTECSETVYYLVRIRDGYYALPAQSVIETLKMTPITPLEGSPPGLAGVISLRSRAIAVIDFAPYTGQSSDPCKPTDYIIILEMNKKSVGLIVNTIENIVTLETSQIGSVTASPTSPDLLPYALGMLYLEEKLVVLLNLEQLFAILYQAQDNKTLATTLSYPERNTAPAQTPFTKLKTEDITKDPKAPSSTLQSWEEIAPRSAYAIVELNREWYGIPLHKVRGFADLKQLTPIPCCPPYILGSTVLRGDSLIVIDVRILLEIDSQDRRDFKKILLLDYQGEMIGVAVHDICDVVEIAQENIGPVPTTLIYIKNSCLLGVVSHQGRMVTLANFSQRLMDSTLTINETVH